MRFNIILFLTFLILPFTKVKIYQLQKEYLWKGTLVSEIAMLARKCSKTAGQNKVEEKKKKNPEGKVMKPDWS